MDVVYEIESRITMNDVFNFYNFKMTRAGFIACPFHNEKTPSLRVYADGKKFKCFGCGVSGSVIDFVRYLFNLDFKEAVSKLNSDFNLGLPIDRKVTLREKRNIQSFKRKRELEKKEKDRKKYILKMIFDSLCRFENNKRIYAPKKIGDEFHPLYIEAIFNIDIYENTLIELEKRWECEG